ncbi:hypothetical protein J6590_031035, partial [Homalodisca vitripennis]
VFKNGDVSWRCLGKTCNASIRSYADLIVVSVNSKHTRQYPVTLRRMSSAAASPAQSPASHYPPSPYHLTTPSPTPSPAAPTTLSSYNTFLAISTTTSSSSTHPLFDPN